MNDIKIELPNFAVLIVDDDDVSAESVIRSFKRHSIKCDIVVACDGLEALDIINNKHDTKFLPDNFIVLLDLNMPRMDGFGFLEAVRSDINLKRTVIFILTTSARDTDRLRAYNDNVAGYMIKSAVGPQFALLAELITKYTQSVILP